MRKLSVYLRPCVIACVGGLALLGNGGCTWTGAAISAGATVVSSAMEERGVDGVANDASIRTGLRGRFFDKDHRLLMQVGIMVFERRVLLTGSVEEAVMKKNAVTLARKSPDVAEVIDEIRVRGPNDTGADVARDTLIANDVRMKLMLDGKIKAVNYSIDVYDRTVYVMGVAQDEEEHQRVLDWCYSADYVRGVSSYVLLKADPRRKELTPSAPAKRG